MVIMFYHHFSHQNVHFWYFMGIPVQGPFSHNDMGDAPRNASIVRATSFAEVQPTKRCRRSNGKFQSPPIGHLSWSQTSWQLGFETKNHNGNHGKWYDVCWACIACTCSRSVDLYQKIWRIPLICFLMVYYFTSTCLFPSTSPCGYGYSSLHPCSPRIHIVFACSFSHLPI
jgi:hypothetical protein